MAQTDPGPRAPQQAERAERGGGSLVVAVLRVGLLGADIDAGAEQMRRQGAFFGAGDKEGSHHALVVLGALTEATRASRERASM